MNGMPAMRGASIIQAMKVIKQGHPSWQHMQYLLLVAFSFFVPFLIAAVLAAANGKNIFDVVPHYPEYDEVERYMYVDSLLKYGKILGCNGFDGSCAAVHEYGTPWGIVWTLPYVVFGALFGWQLNSPVLANLLFCGVVNVVFIFLTNCDRRGVTYLLLANCFLFVNIWYSMTGMAEGSRYGLAIILSGMVYRLMFLNTGKFYRYVAMPLMSILASFLYIILSYYYLIYLFWVCQEMMRRRAVFKLRSAASAYAYMLFVFLLHVYLISRVNGLVTPEYFINSGLSSVMTAEGIYPTISVLVHGVLQNIRTILNATGMELWFALLCCVTMACLLACVAFRNDLTQTDREIVYVSTFILAIVVAVFVVGHAVAYGHTRGVTLVRGINVAICAIIYLSVLMKNKGLYLVLALMSAVHAPSFKARVDYLQNWPYKYISSSARKEIATAVEKMELQVCSAVSANPWDNTVVVLTEGPHLLFEPSCLSHNLVWARGRMLDEVLRKSGYVLFGIGYSRDYLFNKLLSDGYSVVGHNEIYALLKRGSEKDSSASARKFLWQVRTGH